MKKTTTFFAIAFAISSFFSAKAQTDATSFITNPSFEMGDLTGWTWTGTDGYAWLGPNTDGDETKDGSYICGIWNGSIGDTECSQTITGLPNGIYRLTALATVSAGRLTTQRLFATSGTTTKSVLYGASDNPAYLAANLAVLGATETYSFGGYTESTAENGAFKKLAVVAHVTDGNLTLGFRVNGNGNGLGYDFSYTTKGDAGFFKFDNFTLAEVSTVASLDNIKLSVGSLDTVFSSKKTTYTATLPVGTTTVTPDAVVSVDGEIVSGAGEVNVSSGTGSSTIVVKALDGTTTNTYTINYTVLTMSNDATLSDLTFNEGVLTPTFDPAVTTYTLLLPIGTTTVTPYVAVNDAKSSVSGDEDVILVNGKGISTIVVTAENKSTKTYTINYEIEYIVNPSFETFTLATDYPGWTWTGRTGGWVDVNTDGDATKDGKYIAGYWNNNIADVECSQTITGLPSGYYKITALATVSTNRTTTQRLFANTKSMLYGAASNPAYSEANLAILGATETYSFGGYEESTAENGSFKKLSVVTQVLVGNLTLGFRVNGKGTALGYDFSYSPKDDAGFFKFDNFTIAEVSELATLDSITLSVGVLDSVFKSDIITYTATLPVGTTTVTPTVFVSAEGEIVSGAGAVDVSSGTGSSSILVTALDGTTTKTYTINYTVGPTGVKSIIQNKVSYSVINGKLMVKGAESFVVYNLQGMKIADVRKDASNTTVSLNTGIYLVKTDNGSFKVLVK